MRIDTDGTIPKDNPFLSTPGANPAVWALGFRDIHGATLNPNTGELWVAENEPEGGDELNVMRAGKNYGFPLVSYGRQNSGALINDGKTAQEGLEQPLYYWTPSIAPSDITFYTGNAFPAWKDNVFITAMSGEQVVRLVMNGEKVVGEEKLLMDRCKRFKVVNKVIRFYLFADRSDAACPKRDSAAGPGQDHFGKLIARAWAPTITLSEQCQLKTPRAGSIAPGARASHEAGS